ncbi:MAG: membrane protein insertase YidC, partial [Proteobacteria bacterium]|nr:membrane protein insertase YidC [Pseudomonadota bacterium]
VGDAAEWTRTYDRGLYSVEVTNRGASLRRWTLSTYHERTDDGDVPVELISVPDPFSAVLATPLTELGLGDLSNVLWEVESEREDGVGFVVSSDGVEVRKTYQFDADTYGFRLTVEVVNNGSRVVSPRFETLWPAAVRPGQDFVEQSLAANQAGDIERQPVAGIGQPGFFDNLIGSADPDGITRLRGDIEWVGVDNRYFISALLPDRGRDAEVRFEPLVLGEAGVALVGFSPVELVPGQSHSQEFRGFVGPKERVRLEAVSSSLATSINQGWAWAAPLVALFEWMLAAIYSLIPNYGVAIIILTILVRVVTMPIMGRQMKSMEKMRALQPKLKELQEKHGDDKQKKSEEMMALYKKEGVNPLGGCLPMLLQFPVFIGLFYALQSSIDLRQADFMLWITDLSAPEALFTIPGLDIPFRVLPVVMGASMVLQQKFTPTTVDPAQARMMMTIMPVMFTVLFYQFPSGLVLYWMISNFLGIGHQIWVGRRMRAQSS